MTTRFGRMLETLVHGDVAFVVIGGVALVTQGGALAPFALRLQGVDPRKQSDADAVDAFGVSFKVLSLTKLEASKRAAGRPKDFAVVTARSYPRAFATSEVDAAPRSAEAGTMTRCPRQRLPHCGEHRQGCCAHRSSRI